MVDYVLSFVQSLREFLQLLQRGLLASGKLCIVPMQERMKRIESLVVDGRSSGSGRNSKRSIVCGKAELCTLLLLLPHYSNAMPLPFPLLLASFVAGIGGKEREGILGLRVTSITSGACPG